MSPLSSSGFVGRKRELDHLQHHWRTAVGGHGQLVLLVGDPGMGKTRTAGELAAIAERDGAGVLWGRCWDGGGAPAYWPWVQVIRACVRQLDPATLAGCSTADLGEIARIVPEVARALSAPTSQLDHSEHARFRLFDSTAILLRRLAAAQPMLLILDDLQSADEPSLHLLRFLAREIHDSRLMIVGAYRDAEVRQSGSLSRLFATFARDSQRIHLRGLSESEIAELIGQVTGRPPDDELVAEVQSITEGNPFFVDGIARLLPEDPALDQLGIVPIPEEIREAVRRRIDPLGPAAKLVLAAGAVAGRELDERVLARVAGIGLLPTANADGDSAGSPPAPAHPIPVLETLARAVHAGLLVELPGTLGRYAFSHALIVDTLYHDADPLWRRQLHAQIGAVLERLYGDSPEGHEAEIAHHFLLAGESVDADRAIGWATRAGQRALRLLGYEDAVSWFTRALDEDERRRSEVSSVEGGEKANGSAAERRCELLLLLGEALRRAGDLAAAGERFDRAARLARMGGTAEQLARAVLGLGWAGAETGKVNQALVGRIEEALQRLPPGDSKLRAALLGRLSVTLYFAPLDPRRTTASEEAVAMARRIGDAPALEVALLTRHFALWAPGHAAQRLEITRELVRLGERSGNVDSVIEGLWWQITALLELGDMVAARAVMETYSRLSSERRLLRDQWHAAMHQTMLALFHGDYDDARRLAAEALSLGQQSEAENASQFFGVHMFLRLRELGRLGELREPVESLAQRFPSLPIWLCALAFLCSEIGDLAAARRVFEELAGKRFELLPRDGNWLAAVCLLAETCACLEDRERAPILRRLLEPYADENAVIATGIAALGSVSCYVGRLAALSGEPAVAAQQLRRAIERNTGMGAHPWAGWAQLALAEVLTRNPMLARFDDERSELLRAARQTAERCGMIRLRQRVDAANAIAPDEIARAAAGPPEMLLEGEYWSVSYAGRQWQLQHTKGLQYIARLLERPREAIHALELQQDPADGALSHEPRGVEAERARLNVSRAIAAALRRLAAVDDALARHLADRLRTGTWCVYEADPDGSGFPPVT